MGNVLGLLYEEKKVYPLEMAELETQKGLKNIYFYFGNLYEGSDISCESDEEDRREYNLLDE
tara:strand:- start:840 stop:1025 length:186 start_codon:yes stop_codon:yes gene_type:complete